MDPPPLTIHLFGPLHVTVRGEPLPRVRRRSATWLLALLALRHGRTVDRAWLAGTLWPESGESRALQNLRNDLVTLRKALGAEAGRLHAPAPDSLTLELTGAEVDVLQFDAAIRTGDDRALGHAVELYTGPLLEGCLQEWALPERELRAEQCLAALENLAERAQSRGEHREAIRYLRRAEALDPLRDSTQRRLMANLAGAGDPAAAIQTYRDFRIRLQAELLTAPDEETTRLFYEIRAAARRRLAAATRRGDGETGRRGDGETGRGDGSVLSGLPVSPSPPSPRRPVASLAGRPPRPLTPLIGREGAVMEVLERLGPGRLVTLAGGGGVGKTRLALEVAALAAEEFPGGAVWVELAPLADGALLLPTVVAALGVRDERGGDPETLKAGLVSRLSEDAPLLVLDNCEHVLDAAEEVVRTLVEHCPDLHVLATSRQRLGLPGEIVWRVPPLPSPDPEQLPVEAASAIEHSLTFPAIKLFMERAVSANEGFQLVSREEAAAVCRICARLDGIPLALELAAARIRVLTPEQIVARLDDRFRLLTGGARGALPRHQTLRALIDWSYDQLPAAEAALLRRLAVFAGGWTLEAAEGVLGAGCWVLGPERQMPELSTQDPAPSTQHPAPDVLDLLDSLIDRSLVVAEAGAGGRRYRMLETVRAYARERLEEAGEGAGLQERHAGYYLRIAEEVSEALMRPGQEASLARLEWERDNLRAALEWAQAADAAAHLRLAAALWRFWHASGSFSEGRQHLRGALGAGGSLRSRARCAVRGARPERPVPLRTAHGAPRTRAQRASRTRAQALLGAARLAVAQFDMDGAESFVRESLEQFRSLGDARGLAESLVCLGDVALNRAQLRHEYGPARELYTEALEVCRQSGWTQGSALVVMRLGWVATGHAAQWSMLEEAVALAEAVGDPDTLAASLCRLGEVAFAEGDAARARPLLERSLEIRRRLRSQQAIGESLLSLGRAAQRQGDMAGSRAAFEEAAAIFRETGNPRSLGWALLDVGNVHYAHDEYRLAQPLYEESLAIFRQLGLRVGIAVSCNNLGMVLFLQGEYARAQALHREALALYFLQGAYARAQALHREALALYKQRTWVEGIAWTLERLGMVEARHGDPRQAARWLGAASVVRAESGKGMSRRDAADLESAVAALREELGPEGWETAWQEGGDKARFERAMAMVPDREPEERDRLD